MADGRVLKLLNIVDEYAREALEMLVCRNIGADEAVGVLERLAAERARRSTCAATTGRR